MSDQPENEIREVYIYKAANNAKPVESIALVFMDEIKTNTTSDELITIFDLKKVFDLDAEILFQVLKKTLPGGTLDQLTIKLMQNAASSLTIPK